MQLCVAKVLFMASFRYINSGTKPYFQITLSQNNKLEYIFIYFVGYFTKLSVPESCSVE
jgi:hypothetical protein